MKLHEPLDAVTGIRPSPPEAASSTTLPIWIFGTGARVELTNEGGAATIKVVDKDAGVFIQCDGDPGGHLYLCSMDEPARLWVPASE